MGRLACVVLGCCVGMRLHALQDMGARRSLALEAPPVHGGPLSAEVHARGRPPLEEL